MEFSPKVTFAKGSLAQPWTDVASSSLFRDATSAALLQMQQNQGFAGTQHDAMANAYKMEGARQFLWHLLNLTMPPEAAPPRIRNDNLNHAL